MSNNNFGKNFNQCSSSNSSQSYPNQYPNFGQYPNFVQTPKVYDVNTNHPLIPSSQEYLHYKKYVSIHSEDRDCLKYPNSNQFEIELPEDLLNVVSVSLYSWTFPANYNAFSSLNLNIFMSFLITNPYNPGDHDVSTQLYQTMFECLFYSMDKHYFIIIEEGFYNPTQMINELTNKFNEAVTLRITEYYQTKINSGETYNGYSYSDILDQFLSGGGYTRFNIVYNNVTQKIWFGNQADDFTLTNENLIATDYIANNSLCYAGSQDKTFVDWGLPGNLGLSRCNTDAISIVDFKPRFYYGNTSYGNDGYWLLPDPNLKESQVYFIECPYKINLMGPAYFYMEIDGLNCIDETSSYNVSRFTIETNETNGVVNSSFAKIAIPTTPISQWFDKDSYPYKLFMPPAERIRKLKIKLRYHNNLLVNFGRFEYSFMLLFTLLVPQQLRKITTFGGSYNTHS
jgi:hypothetical protein